jgi:two-component SAPR family response regulator
MIIISVDNDAARLKRFGLLLQRTFPGCTLVEFTDPMLSAKYIVNHDVDVVFAEISMRPADGLMLQNVLRTNKPDARVILMQDTPDGSSYGTVKRPQTAKQLVACVWGQ